MNKQYKQQEFANLSNQELEQVSSLENIMSREKGEEVVLVAYKGNEE